MMMRKYSRIRKWSVGLSGGKDRIAVIRASGKCGIIKMISKVRDSKRYKAVIIRIDSPGGDGLASDLIWREIKLLAESKPVVASMVDMAGSGGYQMAMAANGIVSENLTLTGSIGVVHLSSIWRNYMKRLVTKKKLYQRDDKLSCIQMLAHSD
ncbi:putative peptidase S49, ClpP/crotonase-like domain superfamily [Helianthus annuus]|nr:putative peptidase S49, ClpP/crotonase-like domain superfamily [Helianthus annuus]